MECSKLRSLGLRKLKTTPSVFSRSAPGTFHALETPSSFYTLYGDIHRKRADAFIRLSSEVGRRATKEINRAT